MLKKIQCLIAVSIMMSVSTSTFAEKPEMVLTKEIVAEAKKLCETKNADDSERVARVKCVNGIELLFAKQQQKNGKKGLEKKIEQMQAIDAMCNQLLKPREEVEKSRSREEKKVETKKQASPATRPAMQQQAQFAAPPVVMGSMLIDAPFQYLAATWEMSEMMASRIKIENIAFTLRYTFYLDNVEVKIVLKKNGQRLAIAHPSGTANGRPRFVNLFCDLDNDGQPDTTIDNIGRTVIMPFQGMDALNDNVFVNYTPGDSVDIYFLVSSGKYVAGTGQLMWKTLGAFKLQPSQAIARKWDMSPYTGSKIR